MPRRILVVEDEEALCMTLGDRLRNEGYHVDFANDGAEGFQMLQRGHFDLAIIDLMLPIRSGLDLCNDARRAGFHIPIIMLTAKSQVTDKIVGLKMGADDYVCKPFDTAELMARIEAQLRRSDRLPKNSQLPQPLIFQLGDVVLDTGSVRATRDGRVLNLTAKEFQLLHYFAQHRGKTISREEPGQNRRDTDEHQKESGRDDLGDQQQHATDRPVPSRVEVQSHHPSIRLTPGTLGVVPRPAFA